MLYKVCEFFADRKSKMAATTEQSIIQEGPSGDVLKIYFLKGLNHIKKKILIYLDSRT